MKIRRFPRVDHIICAFMLSNILNIKYIYVGFISNTHYIDPLESNSVSTFLEEDFMFSLCLCVPSGCSSFLPQSRDSARLIGVSKGVYVLVCIFQLL